MTSFFGEMRMGMYLFTFPAVAADMMDDLRSWASLVG